MAPSLHDRHADHVQVDPEFSRTTLQDRVVQGAQGGDAVRLHGALTAALNLYPRVEAYAEMFAPAIDRLEGDARRRAREAVNAHLLRAWQRSISS
jgi:hypothetical protein